MTQLGKSDLDVFPLCLGGNVFGWTADRDTSFAILDAYTAGGGNFVDTADVYSAWVEGNSGGESESIIGQWLASRSPQNVIIATKVAQHPEFSGLSAANIRAAAEASLRRLGVETIDLYYAHQEDTSVPLEETVGAFQQLIDDGLVRYAGVSNHSPERIRQWVEIAGDASASPVAIQPHYNLVHRNDVEEHIIPLAQELGLSVLPYYALASGFLTGKYRASEAAGDSPRAGGAAKYATEQGLAILDALGEIAGAHNASITSVSLAWLRQQPTVAAPIASASKPEQVLDLVAGATLELSDDEVSRLSEVSAWQPGS